MAEKEKKSNLYKNKDWLYEQYITLKKSAYEIADICRVNETTIRIWLKKYVIPIRSLSEAQKISHNKPEYKKKMSKAKSGKNNPMFGKFGEEHPHYKDGVGLYTNIHIWINKYFIKPKLCEICGKPEYYDEEYGKMWWSNKTGKLIRDRSNWQYIHVKCHREYDYKNKIFHEGLEGVN